MCPVTPVIYSVYLRFRKCTRGKENVVAVNPSSFIPLCSVLSLPFPSPKEALIAYNSLSVDPEPRRDVSKSLSVKNDTLSM